MVVFFSCFPCLWKNKTWVFCLFGEIFCQDYQTISCQFFSQISASTVSKQITRNHFGLSFEADSDRTVSVAPPKPKCSDDPPLFCPETKSGGSSLVLGPCCRCCYLLSSRTDNKAPKPKLLLLTSEGHGPGCDLKDAECLDDKQIFFQLLSELHDSNDADPGVAAHPHWRWRRMAAAQPSLPSIILIYKYMYIIY